MTDTFTLNIDLNKFRSTNAMWNSLRLNDPWSVGYVSSLIEIYNWESKEQWENFYYAAGEKRNQYINENFTNNNLYNLNFFNDITVSYDRYKYRNLDIDIKNINTQTGRTKEDLYNKGLILYDAVKDNGFHLTIDECFECVRHRVICETWNGIIVRENNTISKLKSLFPTLSFIKSDGEMDHKYAVDYQVYNKNNLICAIQIKPQSYTYNTSYIEKARHTNIKKYALYKEMSGRDVITVISKLNGEIQNNECLYQINALIN